MEIGEEINFLADGKLVWQGSKEDVLDTDNEQLQNFIFASPFLQRLREKAFR
jgi:phospholipid/cholesterol/gamma-HCH transport system ATP-binding protein